TPWGAVTNLDLLLHVVAMEDLADSVNADLELSAGTVQTEWGGAENAQFTARWIHAFTNPIPLSGTSDLICENATSPWGSAGGLHVTARLLVPPEKTVLRSDPSWAWWGALEPYMLDWDCRLANVRAARLEVSEIVCGGNWHAPRLAITNLQADVFGGRL